MKTRPQRSLCLSIFFRIFRRWLPRLGEHARRQRDSRLRILPRAELPRRYPRGSR